MISCFLDPLKPQLRLCARAIRIVKKLSCEVTWTLWRQTDFYIVFHEKYGKLEVLEKFANTCICGASKPRTVVAKFDAAQFFKSAFMETGVRRMKGLFWRVQRKTKKTGVAVIRGQRSQNYFCKASQKSNSHVDIVSFGYIKQML